MPILPSSSPPTPDASSTIEGKVQLTNDLGGTATAPTVVSTHLSAALPIAQGGTGSTTQNFVDLTTSQNVAGAKTWTSNTLFKPTADSTIFWRAQNSTGGALMTIDSANNIIGFGTASPSAAETVTIDGGCRFRQTGSTRYRSDFYVSGGTVNWAAYDDTGAVYIPQMMSGLQMSISTGNQVTGLFIDSSQYCWLGGGSNVGLRINGTSTTATIYQNTGDMTAITNSGNLNLTAGGSKIIAFTTNGSEAARIDSSQRLGVGTTGPTQLLSVAEKFQVNSSGSVPKYNNVATAGWGVPAIYGYGRSTAQSGAVASVATYTVGSSDGSFMVSTNVLVTASTLHSFTVTCTYTDEGNASRTLTLNLSQLTGAFITAITNVTGASAYEGVPVHIRAKASTAITIATTGTFTTVTYNVEGLITQVA